MSVGRIRMRDSSGDYTEQAWDRGEVGVWYGGWSTDDFQRARAEKDPWNNLPRLGIREDDPSVGINPEDRIRCRVEHPL